MDPYSYDYTLSGVTKEVKELNHRVQDYTNGKYQSVNTPTYYHRTQSYRLPPCSFCGRSNHHWQACYQNPNRRPQRINNWQRAHYSDHHSGNERTYRQPFNPHMEEIRMELANLERKLDEKMRKIEEEELEQELTRRLNESIREALRHSQSKRENDLKSDTTHSESPSTSAELPIEKVSDTESYEETKSERIKPEIKNFEPEIELKVENTEPEFNYTELEIDCVEPVMVNIERTESSPTPESGENESERCLKDELLIKVSENELENGNECPKTILEDENCEEKSEIKKLASNDVFENKGEKCSGRSDNEDYVENFELKNVKHTSEPSENKIVKCFENKLSMEAGEKEFKGEECLEIISSQKSSEREAKSKRKKCYKSNRRKKSFKPRKSKMSNKSDVKHHVKERVITSKLCKNRKIPKCAKIHFCPCPSHVLFISAEVDCMTESDQRELSDLRESCVLLF